MQCIFPPLLCRKRINAIYYIACCAHSRWLKVHLNIKEERFLKILELFSCKKFLYANKYGREQLLI